jgi:hypothetical protein
MGRRARRYREQSEIMPGWKEIRSIADVAQPRQPLYAVGRVERLDGPCSILFRLARLALAHSPRAIRFPGPRRSDRLRSFAGQTGRNPAFIVTSGTAIPLPKRIASPVTEFGSSRLTELLIRLEDKVGLIGSRCGLPREGRGRHQRDQRESSDERFHDASPRLRTVVHRFPEHRSRRRVLLDLCDRLPFSLARNCCKMICIDRPTARHWIRIGRRCRRNSPTAPP